ncbi:hypothetical protein B7486_34295 [cyanobacterium TDX16]|nr:hypothetical protein B7486_34295 [cyanobacterium TDX16]
MHLKHGMVKWQVPFLALLSLIPAASAKGQSQSLSSEGTIFGRPYVAIGYDVKPILPSRSDEPWFPTLYNPPTTELVFEPPSLRPEALALKNGLLYIAGDWNETQNQIAVCTTNSWGEIVFDHVIEHPLTNPPPTTTPNNQWWGPEGMTFNTGATGIGAGGSLLVTIDDQQAGIGNTFATVDRTTGVLANLSAMVAADDIAYGPASHRFYLLISVPNSVQVLDANMTPTGASWATPARSRGMTVVSAAFGQALTGDMTLTGDIILVICKEDPDAIPPLKNRLVAYKSDGTQIGDIQDVSWIDSALDNSSQGGTMPGPHEMEAIVVDEANGVIYIGDEAARAVYAVKVVTPATATTSGPVLGRTWQARGNFVELGMPSRSGEPWYATLSGQVNDPPKLRPEAMAFRNGSLYVAGDWNETQNQIGVYATTPNGSLAYTSSIQMPIMNPPPNPNTANNTLWGPEGLTFNTSAAGYGASASALVTVEDQQYLLNGNTRALLNPVTGALSDFGKFTSVVGALSPDDIAYGAMTNRFYVLGDPDIMQVWTSANPPVYAGTQYLLPQRSKGVAVISPTFAQFLLNNPAITQECLLVVAKGSVGSSAAPNNRFYVLTTAGAVLGQQDMLWTREAFPGQPLQEFEAVAVDEANRVIYIGDEKAGGIFSLTVPTALAITTPSPLPNAAEGAAYNQVIAATGGTPPYTFTQTGGIMPMGLSLSTGGQIPGSPSQCGVFNFDVQVTDAAMSTASQSYSLTVLPSGIPGDMDDSGNLDGLDVQRFSAALLGIGTNAEACSGDMNADFVVNTLDVPDFVTALLAG